MPTQRSFATENIGKWPWRVEWRLRRSAEKLDLLCSSYPNDDVYKSYKLFSSLSSVGKWASLSRELLLGSAGEKRSLLVDHAYGTPFVNTWLPQGHQEEDDDDDDDDDFQGKEKEMTTFFGMSVWVEE